MSIAPNDFVHLHTHSEFSLLDGLGRITDLVDTSVKHGFDSLAVTDHGALYGSVAFYQAATKAGIKAQKRIIIPRVSLNLTWALPSIAREGDTRTSL